ncbi:M48 family metallopeptidase [Sphingomonas sp.]|uniref:M48 family metallopeptidase n=1 Tax=Sphingomonas sp. TaxID=28214 RepID=UPI003B00057E
MAYALIVRRHASARRALLRVDAASGAVRLTLPPRMTEARGRAWAEEHRGWIEARLAALPLSRPIMPGATIPLRGRDVTIDWSPDHRRAPEQAGERLRVGGTIEALPRRLIAWLRAEALVLLDRETRAVAADAAVSVGRVSVGDPRVRWGSCTASGDIRYSWRLVMAPEDVLRSTVAHEVAHRLHMNHGPDFRAAERRLFGQDPAVPRAWLRRHGAALHAVGRPASPATDGRSS